MVATLRPNPRTGRYKCGVHVRFDGSKHRASVLVGLQGDYEFEMMTHREFEIVGDSAEAVAAEARAWARQNVPLRYGVDPALVNVVDSKYEILTD